MTQVQTELFCRRPHQPVILQIQYTRDKASVVAVCVCACVCVGVRMQKYAGMCFFVSVSMWMFKTMEDKHIGLQLRIVFIGNESVAYLLD